MDRGSRSPTDEKPTRYLLVLLGIGAVGYLPFLGGGLLTDDFVHLWRQQQRPEFASMFVTPDLFHFFRPLPQASLWLTFRVFGDWPFVYRLTNLLLHVAVAASVFALGRIVLGNLRAAFLGTVAFLLTPKAHPIAVLWISARAELLMSLFSLWAVISWIVWDRSRRSTAFAAACLFYAMALLSKETAVLLPVLLLLTPAQSKRSAASRVVGFMVMVGLAAALLTFRAQAGAMTPTTPNAQYTFMTPAGRWLRSLEVYFPRAIPSPLALVMFVAAPGIVVGYRRAQRVSWPGQLRTQAVYAAVWFVIFILPVLPFPARSEIYLYLPGLGFCFLAGLTADAVLSSVPGRGLEVLGISACVLGVGGYQLTRSRAMHQDLVFSAGLMDGLRSDPVLRRRQGAVVLVPTDREASQFLADTVGGYAFHAIRLATARDDLEGAINYHEEPVPAGALRIACTYQNGGVLLQPSSGR